MTLSNAAVAGYAVQDGVPAKVAADLFSMVALITAVVSAILAPFALLMGRAKAGATPAAG